MIFAKSHYIALICAICIYLPAASACEKLIPFSDEQIERIQAQIANAKEFDLKAVMEYGKLVCAERPFVREFARRIGLASPNGSIRSQAVLGAVMDKEIIVLQVAVTEDLNKDQIAFAQKNPLISYKVVFRDRENACASIHYSNSSKQCEPGYSVSVVGEQMDLRYDNQVATLRLGKNNTMSGTWADTGNSKISVPVTMALD